MVYEYYIASKMEPEYGSLPLLRTCKRVYENALAVSQRVFKRSNYDVNINTIGSFRQLSEDRMRQIKHPKLVKPK